MYIASLNVHTWITFIFGQAISNKEDTSRDEILICALSVDYS